MQRTLACPFFQKAFGWCVPIGGLAGLIGLGGGEFRLPVLMHGIGFDAKFAEQIFVVFQRLHTKHEYEGTGIGLTIVRKAVERMGGAVGVESEAGKGSRFWIELRGVQAS